MKLISTESLRCVTLTEIEARKRLQFLYDSRKIYEANRFAEGIVTSESQIAHFRAICIGIEKFGPQEAFGKPETQEQVLERLRNAYQMAIEKEGEVSCLMEGANLALELNNAHHKIAAWRLLKKLITGSKQQHVWPPFCCQFYATVATHLQLASHALVFLIQAAQPCNPIFAPSSKAPAGASRRSEQRAALCTGHAWVTGQYATGERCA